MYYRIGFEIAPTTVTGRKTSHASHVKDDRHLWIDSVPIQSTAYIRGQSDISSALPCHRGPAAFRMPHSRLQKHLRFSDPL